MTERLPDPTLLEEPIRGYFDQLIRVLSINFEDLEGHVNPTLNYIPIKNEFGGFDDSDIYYDPVEGIYIIDAPFIFSHPYRQESSLYTITLNDEVIECTANTFTVTLPTAVGITGRVFTIDNSGVGVITLEGDGSETINGSLNITITGGNTVTVISNGTVWRIK